MARLILETAGEDVTVGGSDVDVFGTDEGGEIVTVIEGANVTLDASFAAGGDTVVMAGEAETYTAVLVGSRVVITNAAGTTVSIPVSEDGVAVQFGDDDVRLLMAGEDGVMLGAQQITTTEADVDAGNDEAATLTAALTNLQTAEAGVDEFLEDNDTTATEIGANLADAQGRLDAAEDEATLQQLEAEVTAEEADVAAVEAEIAAVADVEGEPSLAEAIEDFRATRTELQQSTAATARAQVAADAALAAYNSANDPDVTLNADGTAEGVIVLNSTGELVLAQGVTEANSFGVTDLLNASRNLEAAQEVQGDDQEAFDEANTSLNAYADGAALEQELATEERQLATAEAAVQTRLDLQAEVEDAQALADQLEARTDAVAEAQADVEALGFETPVTLTDSDVAVEASDENDIFILADNTEGQATIEDFGEEGDDVLFVGGNTYTVVELADNVNLSTSNQGSSTELEVFVQQDGDNTVLYFEDETFSGSTTTGDFQGFEVTLTGVDADTVSLDATGYISIEEPAPATIA